MHNFAMSRKIFSENGVSRPHHRTASGHAQREKTRAAIIQSAIAVFAAQGPDAPVVEDFVKAAGISRGTFYTYFETTRDLLDATVERLSNEVIETIVPAVRDMDDPIARLATAARLYYRKATHDPLFRAFLGSVSSVGSLAAKRVRGDLQEAIDTGLVKVQDVELAQAIAVGVMVFALKTSAAQTGIDGQGAEVVRAILMGLGVAPARIQRALRIELPGATSAATPDA